MREELAILILKRVDRSRHWLNNANWAEDGGLSVLPPYERAELLAFMDQIIGKVVGNLSDIGRIK